jgi:hypothetical protein
VALPNSDTIDTHMPAPTNRSLGLREVALLLVAAAFAAQMFDLADVAVIAAALAVVVWVAGMLRKPRLTPQVTAAIGGGLLVTFMWWPDGGWLVPAITLMWIGIAMIATGAGMWFIERRS